MTPDRFTAPSSASRGATLPISQGHIDIWLVFYQHIADPALLTTLLTHLNESERAQQLRFHFADDRLRYLATRALVRTVLSRYAPLEPADWVFTPNDYGRPAIANDHPQARTLSFNLSHTRGLIAMAVTRDRVLGVDVENLSAREISGAIAEHFFSPAEVAELAGVPPERRQDRFFEYWTFKEAYIKARGMGLSIPLDRFSFHFPDERQVCLAIEPDLGDDAARWRFWQFQPTPDYLLALCAERLDGAEPLLTVRSAIPTVSDVPFAWTLLKADRASR
ncbi:4'-phosphopantetheinyl transferase family protein [Massilia pseudoviolaceinigra]|uniref:4'-phosphopantetheinyl transferase family protein n=1 Tax=Massilia pseudoviolaceinigra TaxID=3057165 RepID=UPI0027964769|nr:4'-phosphopantetheinyl transferase superfamily protein [Massilia sp. CCM 9206]MDQ1919237.1 4'-phosphopantetheinyl transferase superfamily protein [Massilia sp. CCM 9206]